MLTPESHAAFEQLVVYNQLDRDRGIRTADRKLARRAAPDLVVEHRHVLLSNRATITMLVCAMAVLFVLIYIGGNA